MKIIHVNMHVKWGGQPNRILTESRGLAAMGHEVWIAGPKGCMLCERAVVATEVGGTGESVRDGVTGFLVKPAPEQQQIEELAEALGKLLRDPGLRARLGKAGREMVLKEFSPTGLAEKSAEIYERLIAERDRLTP